METHVVAIGNHKGGSGKTSTAVNFGEALADAGHRTLVVDLDPQGNASSWLGHPDDGRGLLTCWAGDGPPLVDLVKATDVDRLDVITAGPALAKLDQATAGEPGREMALRERLASLPADRWRFVLLDLPPAVGLASVSGLVAASGLLLAVESSALAVAGLQGMTQLTAQVRQRLNNRLRLVGVLQTRVDMRTRIAREVRDLLHDRFGDATLDTTIRQDIAMMEAPGHRQTIRRYRPASRAAEDYAAAAAELITRLEASK